jgi:hypothetical protein
MIFHIYCTYVPAIHRTLRTYVAPLLHIGTQAQQACSNDDD